MFEAIIETIPEWLKSEVEQFHQTRIEMLRQITFDELIASRSAFLSTGEITNIGELAYHLLDEQVSEREEPLFESLREKLKSRVSADKIGFYVAMLDTEYEGKFNSVLNRFTYEFLKEYSIDGKINWGKLANL